MIGTRSPMLIAVAALACTVTLVTAGCSPITSTTPATGSTTPSGAASASGSGTVTLLTHDAFAVSDDLVQQFQDRTGLTLKIVTGGDAGAVVAGAVLAAGSPSADVLFGVDNTLVSRALAAQVFDAYTSPETGHVVPALAKDTAGGFVTPIDYGDVCVNIDDRYFAKSGLAAPATLDDLLGEAGRQRGESGRLVDRRLHRRLHGRRWPRRPTARRLLCHKSTGGDRVRG
jgi:thiamine transport system substrate-binding protein